MDRKQEYDTLMQELRQTPPALEGTLDRALDRRRARRRKLRPLRSLAAAAAVFVLLVNVSIPFAQACTHIPVLGWLAQAVCFSHSLSSAVEHDWVQKVEQTQRDNGYTLTLEDLIVDQKQIHLFYTLDWEDPACEYAMVLVDGDRLSPRPTVLSDSVEGPQDAGHIVLDYREGQVPVWTWSSPSAPTGTALPPPGSVSRSRWTHPSPLSARSGRWSSGWSWTDSRSMWTAWRSIPPMPGCC